MKINLLGQTGTSESVAVMDQLTQNWYVHTEQEGKNNICLYPTPGLTSFAATPQGPIRGMIEYNSLLYVVSYDTLWEIDSAGTTTSRGTLNTTTGRVSMAHNGPDNGEQLAIADGTDFYIFDSGATSFTTITQFNDASTTLFNPTTVVYMDGYFICDDPSITGRFHISAAYDGTDWDTLDFATAERNSDALKSIVVSNRVLWLVGEKSVEAWYNNGNADFTFAPVQSGYSEWGTPASESPAEMGGSIFYLSQNTEGKGQVVMTNGLLPKVISTTAITTQINAMTTIDDAYGYVYQYNGHNFYVLSFPTEETTLVYDMTTGTWHTWQSLETGYHRSTHHVFIFNKHMVGDPSSGRVFELDWDEYTEDGDTITRIRRSKSIHGDDKAIRHYSLWVDMEEGTGDFTTTDPQIIMRFRDDGGLWSNNKLRSIGAKGKYKTRVIWRMLGRSRDRVYELKLADPVKAVLIGAYLDIQADSESNR